MSLTMFIFTLIGLVAVIIVDSIFVVTRYSLITVILYSVGLTFSPFTPGMIIISSLIAYIKLASNKIHDFNHKIINVVGTTKVLVFDKTGTMTD